MKAASSGCMEGAATKEDAKFPMAFGKEFETTPLTIDLDDVDSDGTFLVPVRSSFAVKRENSDLDVELTNICVEGKVEPALK